MTARVYLSAPAMCGREMAFINQAFEENWIAPLGPNVNAFEDEVCAYAGAKYAVAMSSGTAAVQMALKALNVGQGDVVFCSSLTFAASCNPVIYQNAAPVFIDSEPDSWNMSPSALLKAFKKYPRPKAVIVVNLYGQSADLDRIMDICGRQGVPVLEDAAESLGAVYKGRMSGTIGKFGVFSFNGNKIITTSGGGMLVCPDGESKAKIVKWITQSRDEARHYEHSELGYNYRLSNVCAGIGRGQLTAIGLRIKKKKEIYYRYKNALADLPCIEMMPVREYGEPNYWLSCMTVKEGCGVGPGDIITALDRENIESRPVWKPMHLQPFYRACDYFVHNRDISADLFKRGLCLPSDVNMGEGELQKVIDVLRACFDV